MPGGGRGGKAAGGSIASCGGRKTRPGGENSGGEVGEAEEGEEAVGEWEEGGGSSRLRTGVFELRRESMQKLEGSFSSLVLNSL
jgi:hypothetical protein